MSYSSGVALRGQSCSVEDPLADAHWVCYEQYVREHPSNNGNRYGRQKSPLWADVSRENEDKEGGQDDKDESSDDHLQDMEGSEISRQVLRVRVPVRGPPADMHRDRR